MTYALLLLILVGGDESAYVLDVHLTRDDCVAAIHKSKNRAVLMAGAEVSLACEPESE